MPPAIQGRTRPPGIPATMNSQESRYASHKTKCAENKKHPGAGKTAERQQSYPGDDS